MKKQIIAAAVVAMLGLTACGESKTSEKTSEKATEAATTAEITTEAAKEEITTEAVTEADIKYEPTDEIINADISSSLIQIGDTIFQNGGYITLSEAVEKYKDKFDVSSVPLDTYFTENNREQDKFLITSLTDPRVNVSIYLYSNEVGPDNPSARIPIGDVPVYDFTPVIMEYDEESEEYEKKSDKTGFVWYPSAIDGSGNYTIDDVQALIEKSGLDENGKEAHGTKYDYYSDQGSYITLNKMPEEPNLAGVYRCYTYKASFDDRLVVQSFGYDSVPITIREKE